MGFSFFRQFTFKGFNSRRQQYSVIWSHPYQNHIDSYPVVLEAENAFGPYNDDNIQHMHRSRFSQDTDLEIGMVMSFADKSNGEIPGVVKSLDGDNVVIDFNHPLAGRDLTFEVEIINVVDADSQAVQLVS